MNINVTEDIRSLLRQQVPIIALETTQENHALELLQQSCRDLSKTLYRWSVTDGLETLGFGPRIQSAGSEMEATALLEAIKSRNDTGVYALCDLHPYIDGEPKNIRLLKDIALNFDVLEKRLVLLSHGLQLPPELRPFVAHAQLSLPSDQEIVAIIRDQARLYSQRHTGQRIRTEGKALDQLVVNLRGLTRRDVERLAYHAIVDDGAITQSDIKEINSAKFALMNQEGMLHYEYNTEDFAQVGGLDNLKQWLQQRKDAFIKQDSRLTPPKGMLLLGVQGGGKSLAAKAVAGLWNLPLLRLDMGAIYNKYIGETEKNLRNSLAQAEAMAPCVLWLDELEKALAQGSNDDGVGKRLLGYFLTWMAERDKPVFLVATSNDIQKLPAELVRKGRFDEIFFVDLPDAEVREQIFTIHLNKRDIDSSALSLERVVDAAEGFSGAEIEQAVISALYALEDQQALTEDDLLRAILSTTPLSVVMAEQLFALRQWAEGRTVKA